MTDKEKLYRVWGKFLKYPQCCVDWFVRVPHNERPEDYDPKAATGSGYLPCPECVENCNTIEGLIEVLGRDPHKDDSWKCLYEETLSNINTDEFREIAKEFDYDYEDYHKWVEDVYEKVNA